MTESDFTTLKRTTNEALCPSLPVSKSLSLSTEKTILASKTKAHDSTCNHSLASMICSRRNGLQSLHAKFAEDMEQRRHVSFQSEKNTSVDEPPMKRRRFQRRNSKTSAMLFSSMASIVAADLEAENEEESNDKATSDEPWGGGVEIAEELVRQLKLRRQNLNGKLSTR